MAKFISRRRPVSARALKRKSAGTVVFHHNGRWEDTRFTRIAGGWLRESDFAGCSVVTSADVARECNMALGCAQSWAEVY